MVACGCEWSGGVRGLVREDQGVVISIGVKGADRVGVVAEPLVAGDVTLDRPGLAAVPGLIEAKYVVIALGTGNPLARTDDVVGILGIDTEVRLRMVVDHHWSGCWISGDATRLIRIGSGTNVLPGVRSGAGRHSGVATRLANGEKRDFRPVAADFLGGSRDVGHAVFGVASGVGTVCLCPLWNVADPRSGARLERHHGKGRGNQNGDTGGHEATCFQRRSLPCHPMAAVIRLALSVIGP